MTEQENGQIAAGEISQWLIDTAGMLRFFSRLPVPPLCRGDDPAVMPQFSRAARTMPIVGAVVALPAALVLAVLSLTALPPLIIATIVLAVLVRSSGAFHEDGLADVADGIGGGRTREDKLRIMRDSRIGTFGGVALVLSLMVRVGAIAALLDRSGALATIAAVMLAAGASRTLMAWISHLLPNARADGASAAFGRPSRAAVVTASVLTLVLAAPVAYVIGLLPCLVALALAVAVTALFGRSVRTVLGGQTGDVLGATQQLSEIALLVGLLVLPLST